MSDTSQLNKYVVSIKGNQVTFTEDIWAAISELVDKEINAARKQGYDPNMLGSWIFMGDAARLQNLDDLYWSYVMEIVAEHDPYAVQTGNYSLEYIKKNMKSASFGSVGIHKILARADQRAKEQIEALKRGKS